MCACSCAHDQITITPQLLDSKDTFEVRQALSVQELSNHLYAEAVEGVVVVWKESVVLQRWVGG